MAGKRAIWKSDNKPYAGGGAYLLRRLPYPEVRTIGDQTYKNKIKQRVRQHSVNFAVTEQERELIDKRMAEAGMKNRRAFLLKMVTEGKIVHIELDSVKEMVRLLSNATNNINQIAKRANTTGSIYAADLDEVRLRYEQIWTQAKAILRELGEL